MRERMKERKDKVERSKRRERIKERKDEGENG